MNLHEYQAKQMLKHYGLSIPKGTFCRNLSEIEAWSIANQSIAFTRRWVAKCQIHAGGRGLSGGILITDAIEEVVAFAKRWLGECLVTEQTGPKGLPVQGILIEEAQEEIVEEFYFSVFFDRNAREVLAIASSQSGTKIEEMAQLEAVFATVTIPINTGPTPDLGNELATKLGLPDRCLAGFIDVFMKLCTFALKKDLSLIEINPLICTPKKQFVCLDAKMSVDDNALYRQSELAALRDPSQEDPRESLANQHGFSYVSLDGDIGCMVNGAGLAMATMDTISLHGGRAANFLDVGGSTTPQRVIDAFKLIVSGPNVKAILVNIFGGIVRCDMIAQGIIEALTHINLTVPIVVRLEGNNAQQAKMILAESQLNIINADNLDDAAQKAVAIITASQAISSGGPQVCQY